MQITVMTGQRKIGWVIAAAVLPCTNMLDVERQYEIVVFVNSAIFATPIRTLANEFSRVASH
jgi:hypothetical protein